MSDKSRLALEKIKLLYGTPKGEFGPTLFVSHHLEELQEADWVGALKLTKPTPEQVLNALILVDEWSSEDNGVNDTFDFSLPNDITNFLISVRFSEDGSITDISMES